MPAFVGAEKSEKIVEEGRISWNENTRELKSAATVRKILLQAPNRL
jgi:hypothetical protein